MAFLHIDMRRGMLFLVDFCKIIDHKVIHVGDDEPVHLIGRVVGLVSPEDIPSEEENQEIIALLSESDE